MRTFIAALCVTALAAASSAQQKAEATPPAGYDAALAKKLGLKGPEDGPDIASELGDIALDGESGVSATVESLTRLLTEGNPLFKNGKLWTPHRPERPHKSEGGIRFQIKSDFKPAGDQPQAIAELVDGVRRQERDQVLAGVALAACRLGEDAAELALADIAVIALQLLLGHQLHAVVGRLLAPLSVLAGAVIALVEGALGPPPEIDAEAAIDLVLGIRAFAQSGRPSLLLSR